MHEELRKTLEHQLQASPSHSLRLSGRGLDVDLVDHLQQQLDTVTQERNSYEELAKQSEEELKELRKSHHDLSQTAKGMKEALSHSKVLFPGASGHYAYAGEVFPVGCTPPLPLHVTLCICHAIGEMSCDNHMTASHPLGQGV